MTAPDRRTPTEAAIDGCALAVGAVAVTTISAAFAAFVIWTLLAWWPTP